MNEIVYIFVVVVLSLQTLLRISHSEFQFSSATCSLLSRHMWLVAATRGCSGANLENPFPIPVPHWTPLQWEAESGNPWVTLGGAEGG